MQNGITYMTRPRMHPSKVSPNVLRISSGAIQLLVGQEVTQRNQIRSRTCRA